MSLSRRYAILFIGCFALTLSTRAAKSTVVYLDLRSELKANYNDSLSLLSVWDDLHTITSLQGLVNRDKPQLFINYIVNEPIAVDSYWWNKYRQAGQWLSQADTICYQSVVDVVRHFKSDIRGVVVYDPNVASTSNVASAVCGSEDLIAVRYDTRPQSLYTRLVTSGLRLPVKVWLINPDGSPLFTGAGNLPGCARVSSGSRKCDPYLWFIEKYMKTGRCNGHYAGYYIDQDWRQRANAAPRNHHTLTNHDFFISHRGFFFDLSPWGDEPATDDQTQKVGTDLATLKELLQQAYVLNKGKGMCYIGGFPAWAYKYTQHAGGSHKDVETEWEFSQLISHYSAFKDADAIGFGALANASFWMHYPLRKQYKQSWTTTEQLKQKNLLDASGHTKTKGKNYIIVYVGDYDASSWVSQRTADIWDSSQRGHFPMMWCISPVLSSRIPQALDYIRRTASPNDYFAAADNGAGYMMPGIAEAEDALQGETNRIDNWTAHCKKFYRQWGISVTGFIIDGNGPAMGSRSLDAYAQFSPNGIVPQKCPVTSIYKDMPVLRSDWDLVDDDPVKAARVLVERVQGRDIPFHWFRCILKSPEWYNQVIQEAQRIDPSIQLLDAPSYFELYRRWLKEH